MLNDEICKKRDELNKSIENNDDYDKIYKISVELDELIAKYYMEKSSYEGIEEEKVEQRERRRQRKEEKVEQRERRRQRKEKK